MSTYTRPGWIALAVLAPVFLSLWIALSAIPARPDEGPSQSGPTHDAAPTAELTSLDYASAESVVTAVTHHRLLRSERDFLEAWKTASRSPAPALMIDLADSLAVLTVNGVPVRESRIHDFRTSALLDRTTGSASATPELAMPFSLLSATATIPHQPIRVVHAPKDSTEARLRPPDAFVVDDSDAHVTLHFDRDLVIHLTPAVSRENMFDRIAFALKIRAQNAGKLLASVLGDAPPPATRWIRLRMDASDIRAIYRALPDEAQLAVRLPDQG